MLIADSEREGGERRTTKQKGKEGIKGEMDRE